MLEEIYKYVGKIIGIVDLRYEFIHYQLIMDNYLLLKPYLIEDKETLFIFSWSIIYGV